MTNLLLGVALGPVAGPPSRLPDLDAALRIARAFKYNPAEALGLPRAPLSLPPDLAEICRVFSWNPAEAAALAPVAPGLFGVGLVPLPHPRPSPPFFLLPPPPPPAWPPPPVPAPPELRR